MLFSVLRICCGCARVPHETGMPMHLLPGKHCEIGSVCLEVVKLNLSTEMEGLFKFSSGKFFFPILFQLNGQYNSFLKTLSENRLATFGC